MSQNPYQVIPVPSTLSKLNVAAATVVKASSGRVAKIVVLTSATFILNDCATVAAAATANEIYTGSTVAVGTVIALDWPCATGITIGTMSAGTISISYE